jgi:hypothetical protein
MRISFAAFMLISSSYLSNDSVKAITEDMDELSMRDAGASKERPRLTG